MLILLLIIIFSLPIIDKLINRAIFIPPIKGIFDPNSKIYFCNSINNYMISYCHLKPKNKKSKKYIVYSHGNAIDITEMRKIINFIIDDQNLDFNFILYDYIGYGFSENKVPNEELCYESLDAIITLLRKSGIPEEDIYLMGQSLGTGVILDYVSKNNWSNPIILISPYKSIFSIISKYLGNIPGDRFKSISKIKNINCKVKIIHGLLDDLITINHSYDLLKELPNYLKFNPIWLKANHYDIIYKIDFREHLFDVFND